MKSFQITEWCHELFLMQAVTGGTKGQHEGFSGLIAGKVEPQQMRFFDRAAAKTECNT